MIQATKNYLTFLRRCAHIAFIGDWRYYTWMGALTVIVLLGLNAYARQFVHGLITTGMSDEVSWGVYIANFTFLVGVAAAQKGMFNIFLAVFFVTLAFAFVEPYFFVGYLISIALFGASYDRAASG